MAFRKAFSSSVPITNFEVSVSANCAAILEKMDCKIQKWNVHEGTMGREIEDDHLRYQM